MNAKSCRRVIIAGSLLVIAVVCLGQAITTKELLMAANQNSASITDLAANGAGNQPPSAKSLTPDREGPQTAGSRVSWTVNAYDPDGDRLLYQFWLNGPATGNTWKPMTGWIENNTWNWTTSPVDSGLNIIDIRIRDERHAGPWSHDSHISAEYTIDDIQGSSQDSRANSIPALRSIKSDRQSPQDLGIKITWTATASDPEGDTVLYQFLLKGPSTEDVWLPETLWTTNNVWTWDTTNTKAGIYTIEARIRDGYHSDAEGWDAFTRSAFIIKDRKSVV